MKLRTAFSAFLLVLLSACQMMPPREMDALEGATLTLSEPITFPAGDARLHIQGGETRPYWRVDQYRTHCQLELEGARDQAHVIEPGEFRVARVRYEWDQVSSDSIKVAALGVIAGGGSVSSRIEIVVFELESETQPEFARVRCSQWMEPHWARTPTLEEVRWALGENFRLEPRAGS